MRFVAKLMLVPSRKSSEMDIRGGLPFGWFIEFDTGGSLVWRRD